MGKLFEKGIYDPEIIVSVGGSGAIAPYIAKTIFGAPISSLLKNQNLKKTLTSKSYLIKKLLGFMGHLKQI